MSDRLGCVPFTLVLGTEGVKVCVIVSGALSLKLLKVGVPPYILRGEMALLQCQYDLENDRLYSVTWYKDHEEFYRYVPKSHPPQHSYPLEGIKVDVRFIAL